ncbi:hypothetical protein KAZ66_01785 [Candidatus Woesebacteria bacterium]|nr:hypothetical protein [Candidatus Woesebacteria bacterium]
MYHDVPKNILDQLKGEPVDFIVQSTHDYVKRSLGWIMGGLTFIFAPFLLFPLLFSVPIFEILIKGSTTITVNGTPEIYTTVNPWGAILFAVFPISLIFLIFAPFIWLFIKAFKMVNRKGKWYAGTNQHLIECSQDSIDYYRWSEFEDTIKTNVKNGKMDIIMTLKKNHIPQQDAATQQLSSVNIAFNGKTIDLQNSHFLFMNKIGLLGLTNGNFVLNMIQHNMEGIKK